MHQSQGPLILAKDPQGRAKMAHCLGARPK
jgi:hypothetical protein